MHVELLYWDGCPSHPQALADLRAAMGELGLDPDAVLVREIDTEDAERALDDLRAGRLEGSAVLVP